MYMTSPEAKPLWAAGSAQLTRVAKDFFGVRKEERERARASDGKEGKYAWPESEEARAIRAREEKTQRKAIAVIALGHLKRLWSGGPRGWALLFQLALITARMSALALVQTAFAGMGEIAETFLKFLWSAATAPVRFVTKSAPALETTRKPVSTNDEFQPKVGRLCKTTMIDYFHVTFWALSISFFLSLIALAISPSAP